MDNLAHTLAGAALGEAGLKKKTGLGMATLMIAANLPDLDAIGLFFGHNLAWRRGWTHGPVALVLLPPLLAWIMVAFDRWQARRGKRPQDRLPVRFGWVLALQTMTSTGDPGSFARLGVWSGQGAKYDLHQPTFELDERALFVGVRTMVHAALTTLTA